MCRGYSHQSLVFCNYLVQNHKIIPQFVAILEFMFECMLAPSGGSFRFGKNCFIFHFTGTFRLAQVFGELGLNHEIRLI